MIFKSLSIRSKLILTTLVLVIFLTILALIYMDASGHLNNQAELLQQRANLHTQLQSLCTSHHLLMIERDYNQVGAFRRQINQLDRQMGDLLKHETLAGDQEIQHKVQQIFAVLNQLGTHVQVPDSTDANDWKRASLDMEVLQGLMDEMDQSLSEKQNLFRIKKNRQLEILLALVILLFVSYMILFAMNTGRAFQKLIEFTRQLKSGALPPPLEFTSTDEFKLVAQNMNDHVGDLQKKIDLLTSMSKEGPSEIYQPGAEDKLGNAMVMLTGFLTQKEMEEVIRNREDKRRNWISEGLAQLGEVLRMDRENVAELSYLIVQKLVTYMKLEMGSLYITNQSNPSQLSLDLVASYAYDRRKFHTTNIKWGEELPGTCAQEKEPIFLTDVPEDYFEISTGTGSAKPNCILLVPLKIDHLVYGVVELATVRLLRPFEIEFVESLSESIASSLLAVRTTERTSMLLKQSQEQAEALIKQDVAMRENLKKLEHAQEDSSKKETEISGILNAINQSSLVAELGLNGRFSSINDHFLLLLESHRDQVVGKHHKDFAQVDPYSDSYKEFWELLKEGKSISKVEIYKLFSGKEVWLQQTFSPIFNNERKVYKVLNIAVDITEKRAMEDRLKLREQEIKRSGNDMKSLNQTLSSLLIKCELDTEGIILDVNEHYTHVFGYGRKELLGRNYRLFLKDSEKDPFEQTWKEVIKEKVYSGIIHRTKPTGEEIWLDSTFSPVKDETGVLFKVYFVGLDITEKKLKYQLLEEANLKIERLKEQLKE